MSNLVAAVADSVVGPVAGASDAVVGATDSTLDAVARLGSDITTLAGEVGRTTETLAKDLGAVAELVTSQRAAREDAATEWFARMQPYTKDLLGSAAEEAASSSSSDDEEAPQADGARRARPTLTGLTEEQRQELESVVGLAANSAIQQGPEGATRILELSNEVYEAMARAEEAERG